MKKLVALVMGLMMMLMMVAGCGSDGPKKMVIGLDDNFAPMGYRNEKNEIVGMDIDLAREACTRPHKCRLAVVRLACYNLHEKKAKER